MTGSLPPADVVVIGGGLVGTSMAYELVAAGASTVLVDRGDPGRATDAGAGILSPETFQDPEPGTFDIGIAAARHYESLITRLADDGATDTGFAVTGSLFISIGPGEDEYMERAVRLITERSPAVQEIDPTEAAAYFPPLGPVRRALFNQAGRRVDGRALNAALRTAAVSRGLRVVQAGATGLDVDAQRRTVSAVITPEGSVPTGAVALAGGAWTAELSGTFGIDLPVAPLKGQIIHLSLPATNSETWPIVQPVLGYYLVPWPDGRVACGGTLEPDAGYDHRPTAHGVQQLLRECLHTAPGLAEATLIETRVGSRPSSVDGRPIVGRVPGWNNAFVATGHGTEGLLLGPVSAAIVARSILGSEDEEGESAEGVLSARLLDAWTPQRFTSRQQR
jgi:D-amino-acid dehydrogenase